MATRGPILIVDDDPAIRELIALALEPHAVVHADAASSAMAHVERGGPAAVLLDHRLPDRSGLDLLADIRCARPDVPVIMMTGYGSERLCAAALKLGVWDYFPKPVDLRELVRSVERALGAGAPAAGGTALGGPSVRPAAVPPAHPPDLAIQKSSRSSTIATGIACPCRAWPARSA